MTSLAGLSKYIDSFHLECFKMVSDLLNLNYEDLNALLTQCNVRSDSRIKIKKHLRKLNFSVVKDPLPHLIYQKIIIVNDDEYDISLPKSFSHRSWDLCKEFNKSEHFYPPFLEVFDIKIDALLGLLSCQGEWSDSLSGINYLNLLELLFASPQKLDNILGNISCPCEPKNHIQKQCLDNWEKLLNKCFISVEDAPLSPTDFVYNITSENIIPEDEYYSEMSKHDDVSHI